MALSKRLYTIDIPLKWWYDGGVGEITPQTQTAGLSGEIPKPASTVDLKEHTMHTKSTAKRAAPATTYKPRVSLTGKRGWYRVQSGTTPSVYYETTANSCTCPARKPCKHMRFVRRLNVAFYVRKEAVPPAAAPAKASGASVGGELAAAAQLLALKRRALADAHPQSDEYAVLLHAVDQAERQVAALDARAIRAA